MTADPVVQVENLSVEPDAPAKVVIAIEKGKPVLISRLDILLEGDAGSDDIFSALLDKLPKGIKLVMHGRKNLTIATVVEPVEDVVVAVVAARRCIVSDFQMPMKSICTRRKSPRCAN